MNKNEIVDKIEQFAPLDLQEKWDCSSWIVKTENCEIKKVLIALTVTESVFEQALAYGADMIISHHPLFFVPLKFKEIDIYCSHTNTDKTLGGTTDTLIELLGCEVKFVESEFLRVVELDVPIEVMKFAEKLKKISTNIRLINNNDMKQVQKIGFCAGSGADLLDEAEKLGLDCFVTGDIKYHTAVETQMVLFDIGHFESEIPILKVFAGLIKDERIEVLIANEKSPFKII